MHEVSACSYIQALTSCMLVQFLTVIVTFGIPVFNAIPAAGNAYNFYTYKPHDY